MSEWNTVTISIIALQWARKHVPKMCVSFWVEEKLIINNKKKKERNLSMDDFKGCVSWISGCVGRRVSSPFPHLLKDDDVVSCCLDLTAPCISFRVNGLPVQGMLENFNADGLLYPVVSFSAGVKSVMEICFCLTGLYDSKVFFLLNMLYSITCNLFLVGCPFSIVKNNNKS